MGPHSFSLTLLCPARGIVPAFQMLIWEQETVAETTSTITETCNMGPSKELQAGSPGPPADRPTWLASGHSQHLGEASFWALAHSRAGLTPQ